MTPRKRRSGPERQPRSGAPARGDRRGGRPYHHGDLRRAVLDEALALIEELGHLDFTLREVARRIGVSHGAPYRHFADRRALLTALAVEGTNEMASRIGDALCAAGPALRDRFLAAGFAYVRFALERPAAFRVMFSGQADGDDPAMREAKERSFGLLLRFVEEAQTARAFPPGAPLVLARAAFAMHHGLASLAALGVLGEGGPVELRAAVDDAHARLLDGLMVPPTKRSSASRRRAV